MADILIYVKSRPVIRRIGVREVGFNYRTEYYYSTDSKQVYTVAVDENYYQFSLETTERIDAFISEGEDGYVFIQVYHDGSGGVTLSRTPAVSAVVTATDVLCRGAATGSVLLNSLAGGSGQYAFLWHDGATSQNRLNVPVGDYWADVYDQAEPLNRIRLYASISQPATAITIGGTKTDNVCFGAAAGRIEVTVLGGTPWTTESGPMPAGSEYSYLWNDGVTTRDRSGLRAGNYEITVTDANGCVRSRKFTIFQNTEILVTATVNEDAVTLDVSGGKPGYSFLWSDGATTRDRASLLPGSYQVTVTDAAACKKSVNVSIQKFQFWFSKNFIPLRLVAVEPETKPNLTFLCEVWLEETYLSGNFAKVYEMELPADRDHSATFDVQPILDAYLSPFLPEGVENQVVQARSLFRRFYLKHSEKFGTPPVPGSYSQADVSMVLLGGLSYEEAATRTFFSSYLVNQKPFFTWEPLDKAAFADQPEYLYYLVPGKGIFSIFAFVKITYQDGTQLLVKFHSQGGVNPYEVWTIPAGYDQLSLGSYQPGKAIAAWEVFVSDSAGNPISETRRYTLRTDYAPNRRYFLYLNSLGGYNTLATTGAARLELDPEVQQIERVLRPGYQISAGETVVINKFGKPSLKLSTGYLSKGYMAALQDFVISESVLLLDRGRYVPGTVDPKSIVVDDEDETVSKMDFEFSLPKMYRYTPRL